MRINKKDINIWGSTFIKYSVESSEVEIKDFWGVNAIKPLVPKVLYKYKPLKVSILMEAEDRQELENFKSSLISEMGKECWIDFEDANFQYLSTIKNIEYSPITQLAIEVNLEFKSLQFGAEVTLKLLKQTKQTLNIKGTNTTSSRISIIPATNISIFTINDITIKDLRVGKEYIIDGISKKITVDGDNAFKQVDLDRFPQVEVGSYIVNMNNTNVNVEISYRPRFK